MVPYTFESLSPTDFEALSRDLLQLELGVTLESFKAGRDGGIDLRYAADPEQTLVVQCKHYRGSGLAKLASHLKKSELSKIVRLNPTRYVLSTSLGLSPNDKFNIQHELSPYVQAPRDVYGADDLNNLLGKYPAIERRHFKLWLASAEALDQFFNRAVRMRSDTLVERVKANLRLYASNDSLRRALDVLAEHHCCIIAGEPGIGKTMLADVLMVHYLDQGYEVIVISRDITEAESAFVPDAKQFFYYDDFLGTAFDEVLPKNEDSRLVGFIRRVAHSANKCIVLTTREYIFKNAAARYERLSQVAKVERKCIVALADYTMRVRADILYNHIYFSALEPSARAALLAQQAYLKVIAHPNFNPRLIEHAIVLAVSNGVPGSDFAQFLLSVLDQPKKVWEHAFCSQLPAAA